MKNLYGEAPATKFNIETSDDFITGFQLSFVENTRFLMHNALRDFSTPMAEGDCHIVSVGTFDENIDAVKAQRSQRWRFDQALENYF